MQTESKPQTRLLFHIKVISCFRDGGWLLSISNAQAAEVERGMSANSGTASPKSGDLWSPRSQVSPFLLIFAGFSNWETTKHRIAPFLICSQLSSWLTFRYASRRRGLAVSFLTGQCSRQPFRCTPISTCPVMAPKPTGNRKCDKLMKLFHWRPGTPQPTESSIDIAPTQLASDHPPATGVGRQHRTSGAESSRYRTNIYQARESIREGQIF